MWADALLTELSPAPLIFKICFSPTGYVGVCLCVCLCVYTGYDGGGYYL